MFLDIPVEDDVSEVRLNGLPVGGNADTTATVFYSTDGSSMTPVEPAERVLSKPQTVFPIGVSGVKRIQVRLSKTAADTSTVGGRQYVYAFMLDSVQVFNNSYRLATSAQLVAGPYDVLDVNGVDVAFTKLALRPCVVKPAGTMVNWYVSVDQSTWIPVEERTGHAPIISFGSNLPGASAGVLDSTALAGSLQSSVVGLNNITYRDEAVLNTYIHSSYADVVPLSEVVIKRNIPDSATSVLGVTSGWRRQGGMFTCHFEVNSPTGIGLDFGHTNAYINGQLVTGRTHVAQGHYDFATSTANWQEIAGTMSSTEDFVRADSLYPYNHRYIIGGYQYPGHYEGVRPYIGVDEHYGARLQYLAPEDFANLAANDERYYNSFTVENVDGDLLFKVKVDKTDVSWSEELYDTTWVLQVGPSTRFWVKAILNTSNPDVTPVINSFTARVI